MSVRQPLVSGPLKLCLVASLLTPACFDPLVEDPGTTAAGAVPPVGTVDGAPAPGVPAASGVPVVPPTPPVTPSATATPTPVTPGATPPPLSPGPSPTEVTSGDSVPSSSGPAGGGAAAETSASTSEQSGDAGVISFEAGNSATDAGSTE